MGGDDWGSRAGRGTVDWESAPPATSDPLGTPDDARYPGGAVVGAGGMGRVEAVVDQRLGREVAKKTLRPDLLGQASAQARFLREVRITARLDHPGIVPIFDAGRGPDGAPWYTMRLVRGRTFDDGLATADLAARMALVPRFLAACEAVAYAHANGVVHRDLKPANLLVGAYGETQVADWGIAREVGVADDLGAVATGEGTRVGAVLGTPGWMSPEQERGEPAGPASDVFALGRVLRAVLTGQSPPEGAVPDGVPADLVAIAARATAPLPADRYPDASALAADVSAWLAGRRVSAYAYPPWELARRLAYAWRAPIAVAAVASVAVLGAVVAGYARVAVERDRAVLAEEAMREVLVADHVADAVAALKAGELSVAAEKASSALALADDPGARGVVAALEGYGPHPRLVLDRPVPPCVAAALDPVGETLACAGADSVSLWPVGGDEPLWSVPSDGLDVARPAAGGPIYAITTTSLTTHDPADGAATVLSRSGGGRGLVRVGPTAAVVDSTRLWRPGEPEIDCGRPAQAYDAAFRDGTWLLPCTDWRFQRFGADTGVVDLTGHPFGGPTTVAYLDAHTAIAGTIDGEVVRFDVATGTVLGAARGSGPVRRLVPSPDGRLVAVGGERGTVRLLAVPSMVWVAGIDATASEMAWRPDGTLVTVGERVRAWAFDGPVQWGVVTSEAGLDGVAVRADGLVTLHDGSGNVVAYAPDGVVAARLHWQDGVVKEGEHAPDRFVVVGLYGQGVRSFDRDWNPLPPRGVREYRDIVLLADGTWGAVAWTGGVDLLHPDGSVTVLVPDLPVAAVTGATDGVRWIAVADPAGLAVLDGDVVRWRDDAFRGRATLSADGSTAWTLADGQAHHLDADGVESAAFPVPSDVTALATSADGSLVAVGFLDGTAHVYAADGALLAILAGHDERVSDLRFAEDFLVSAGWDGAARRWALAPMTRSGNGGSQQSQHTGALPQR